jgi:hypothetical protein
VRACVFALAVVLAVGLFADPGPETVSLYAADYGEAWPLTIDRAELRCEGAGAVVVRDGQREFGVNGTAIAAGYARLNPIWRDDPSGFEPKVSIRPLIARGLSLCRE